MTEPLWPSRDVIERAARAAAWQHPSRLIPYEDRYEAAWDGILEAVGSGQEGDLRDFGKIGINKAVIAVHHHYGIPRSGSEGHEHTGRAHAVYWHPAAQPHSFADDLVDKLAVRQIFDALAPRHQDTLRTYIEAGCSIGGTASALGISYALANSRICAARNAAKKLWFEPDKPPPQWHRSMPGKDIDYMQFRRSLRSWNKRQAKKQSALVMTQRPVDDRRRRARQRTRAHRSTEDFRLRGFQREKPGVQVQGHRAFNSPDPAFMIIHADRQRCQLLDHHSQLRGLLTQLDADLAQLPLDAGVLHRLDVVSHG